MDEKTRRRREIAAAAWQERQPYGPFAVRAGLADWAEALVAGTEVARLALLPATTDAWARTLGVDDSYIGRSLDALLARGLSDSIIATPEPGEIAIAYAHRDGMTEDETHLGWGFRPAAVPELTLHATRAIAIPELAGGPDVTGSAAVIAAITAAVASLQEGVRPGQV